MFSSFSSCWTRRRKRTRLPVLSSKVKCASGSRTQPAGCPQPRSCCSYVDKTLSLKIRRKRLCCREYGVQHFVGDPALTSGCMLLVPFAAYQRSDQQRFLRSVRVTGISQQTREFEHGHYLINKCPGCAFAYRAYIVGGQAKRPAKLVLSSATTQHTCFFSHTSRMEIAAGVTPEIRDARR